MHHQRAHPFPNQRLTADIRFQILCSGDVPGPGFSDPIPVDKEPVKQAVDQADGQHLQEALDESPGTVQAIGHGRDKDQHRQEDHNT